MLTLNIKSLLAIILGMVKWICMFQLVLESAH